ncbi:hypothetical protein LCGC14_1226540 [marine sediment metagenome]|uniref:Uncharacterized protein n=1 Tax=marine sediment metagenome TaxID=412755 RepID=A0A0F9NS04_9ZZZZ
MNKHNESQAHIELKQKAVVFLEDMGCIEIEVEKRIGSYGKSKRFDVLGRLNGKRIAVECGGLKVNGDFSTWLGCGRLSKLYVWPYGEDTPYEWQAGIKVCNKCGHKC